MEWGTRHRRVVSRNHRDEETAATLLGRGGRGWHAAHRARAPGRHYVGPTGSLCGRVPL